MNRELVDQLILALEHYDDESTEDHYEVAKRLAAVLDSEDIQESLRQVYEEVPHDYTYSR